MYAIKHIQQLKKKLLRISLAVSLRHLSEQNKAALRLNLRIAAVMLLQLDGQSSCKALSINHLDGAGNRNRTYDLRVTSALLYLLSYAGIPIKNNKL
jgi:hypothetical protein